jgi:hypothetical protein
LAKCLQKSVPYPSANAKQTTRPISFSIAQRAKGMSLNAIYPISRIRPQKRYSPSTAFQI